MANSGVNVKMGVSGIQQFKQSMNVAKNSVKTLDAQLALNEKQFKQTGDAETYMANKSDLLKAKMSEQKAIIDQAEKALEKMKTNGVTPASKAFQDMQQQLLSAKGALIDTETELGNIGIAAGEAETGVSNMATQMNELGKKISFDNISNGLSSISASMSSLVKKAIELGEQMVRSTLGAGSWADELKTTAAQMSTADYEVTPEDLQRMRKTATLIDTDVETIVAARQKLNKTLADRTGAADTLETLLGTTVISTNAEDNFWAIGDAILKMGNAEEQEAAAQKMFGRSWRELIPLFQAGREEYEKTNASWDVVENDQIDALGRMDDQYQKMTGAWETFKMEILSAFSGPLTDGMKTITDLLAQFNEYLDSPEGKEMLDSLGNAVSALISDLTKVDPEQAVEGLKGIIDDIKGAFQWIAENKDGVVTAIEAFGVAFAGIKIAEFATNLWKVVDGFKTLWAGKDNPLPSLPGTDGSDSGGGGPTVVPKGTGGTGIKASLASLFGAGSSFSMMGGAATFGPLAAMAAAGYAGWKMVEANGNDPTLQKIYGYGRGPEGVSGGLFDTMTPQLAAAVARYWELYQDTGSEEAMEARENLYKLLEEGGFGEHPELATQLIEQAFDNKLNEHDIDGLVAKLDQMLELASGGNNGAKMGLLTSGNMTKQEAAELGAIIGREVNSAIERLGIYMDGHKVGQITAPYVGDELAGMVYEFTQ